MFLKDLTWQFCPTAGFKQLAGRIVLLCHFIFFVLKFTANNTYKKAKPKTLFLDELLLRKSNPRDFLHTLHLETLLWHFNICVCSRSHNQLLNRCACVKGSQLAVLWVLMQNVH